MAAVQVPNPTSFFGTNSKTSRPQGTVPRAQLSQRHSVSPAGSLADLPAKPSLGAHGPEAEARSDWLILCIRYVESLFATWPQLAPLGRTWHERHQAARDICESAWALSSQRRHNFMARL